MTSNELSVQSSLQAASTKVTPSKATSSLDAVVKIESQAISKEQDEKQPLVLQEQQEQLEAKVAELNDYVQHLNRNLQFSVDEQSGQTVVKVVDAETKELVRQIPSQEVLDARNAVDDYRGLLLQTKV